ncbi:MAG: hypothetical protein J6J36_00260 [Clostridia bacterium]|nr:hypothetical protein [Clostridia bacterium]
MNENNEMNNEKKSGFLSGVIITILVIAIIGLIIGIVGSKSGWFNKIENTQNNTTISENEANSGKNVVSSNESKKDNNKDNNKDGNTTSGNTTNNSNVNKNKPKKIDIDDEALVELLKYEEPFSNGQSLSNQRYLQIAYNAINEGYIVIDKDRSPESGKSQVKYTENEINSIIYSIFGVTLSKNEDLGSVIKYKDGIYTIEFSDRGTTTGEAKNIEGDVAAGTRFITFDLTSHDLETDNKENLGTYAIGIRGEDGFVTSYRKMND